MSKYIVTIAPPTPNGDLHLGHIAGPYLAADIFTRIRRMLQDEVIFVCYSDDYQDYVARMAIMKNKNKFEHAVRYSERIAATLLNVNIVLDCFMKAYDNQFFKDAVTMFYQKAVAANSIGTKKDTVPYEKINDAYGYEAFGRGICNFCKEESDASQCEACGFVPVLKKMGNIVSILSGEKMDFVEKQREYLKIGNYAADLKKHYKDYPPIRADLVTYIDEALEQCDLDWFIDRPDGHGIDIEVNQEKKIIHTWFSGLAGYYAATREYSYQIKREDYYKEFWMSDNTKIVNFLGFDCSFSHAIVYPSLLSNLNSNARVYPITNKFLKLEGGDFSTSRGHAIWVDDILKEVPSDPLRFYLSLVSPEEEVKNFEKDQFLHWYKYSYCVFEELLNAYFDQGYTPEYDFDSIEAGLLQTINEFRQKWLLFGGLGNFSISKLAAVLQDFFLLIIQQLKLQKTNKDIDSLVTLYLIMANPLHPHISQQAINQYKIDEQKVVDWLVA